MSLHPFKVKDNICLLGELKARGRKDYLIYSMPCQSSGIDGVNVVHQEVGVLLKSRAVKPLKTTIKISFPGNSPTS